MHIYWSVLEKVKGSSLRLTKLDDEIYEHFKRDFPEIDPAETLDEDAMKSPQGKKRWREFMMTYEKKVDEYNFGTMLRSNPKWEYGKEETIFGERAHSRRGICRFCLHFWQCRGFNFMRLRLQGKTDPTIIGSWSSLLMATFQEPEWVERLDS